MKSKKKTSRVSVVGRVGVAVGVGAVILAAAAYFTGLVGGHPKLEGEPASAKVESKAGPSDTVDLTEKQVASIKVEPVGERLFAVEKGAVGNIDYNQDMAVQVFTNYQGRINGLFAKVGDDVKKDQILFTIDSPDLLQAESTLIAADGVLLMTTRVLNRQKALFEAKAAAQKDVDQATSDQQTAEGALLAARNAVSVFGKTEAEIDRVVAQRKVDFDADCLKPDHRTCHGPQRGARALRPAGQSAGTLHRCRSLDQMDVCQCDRERHPILPPRAAGAGQGHGLS